MSEQHKEHILPIKVYLGVAGALLVLTAVTVAVSFVDLGGWNVVVAILIASIKALLVAMFFMHLLYDNKINLFIFGAAVIFLAVFIIFTMFDTMRRGDIDEYLQHPIQKQAAMYQGMSADSTHSAGHGEKSGQAQDSTQHDPSSTDSSTNHEVNH